MAVDIAGHLAHTHLDFKSAQLPVIAVVLKTTTIEDIAQALTQQLAHTPEFFDNVPVVLNLSAICGDHQTIDFAALVRLLRTHHTQPVAVHGGNPEQMQAAREAGLADTLEPRIQSPREVIREVEVVREVATPAPAPLVVDQPLRSGQQVYARDSDLIVLAAVSFGAEIIADGNIHVYAPLRGRALAGAQGNINARIFSTCMEPQLLSIAGLYRTTETALPDTVQGKCAQAWLSGENMLVEPL